MKALWVGRVEILTEPAEWGDTKAFSNVVARADNCIDFRRHVSLVCDGYDWSLLEVEECHPANALTGITSEELLEALERAEHDPKACIFTTLHYYPSKPT